MVSLQVPFPSFWDPRNKGIHSTLDLGENTFLMGRKVEIDINKSLSTYDHYDDHHLSPPTSLSIF